MRSTYLLFLLVLILGCQNGSLTNGVGQTMEYVSLIERMNEQMEMKSDLFEGLEGVSSFTDFEITGIESIDQLNSSSAHFSVPGLEIDSFFNRTEIIRVRVRSIENQNPTLFVNYLIATNNKYYSESEFPIEELFAVLGFTELDNNDLSNRLTVEYYKDRLAIYSGLKNDQIQKNGSRLSYEFSEYQFAAYQDYNIFIGTGLGSGYIQAEKLGEFPDF